MDTIGTETPDTGKETGRVEAFSDGVFAIAITLLVLDIKVPRDLPAGTSLSSELVKQWPIYLAFLTSFGTIGIMWLNHHRMCKYIQRVDHWFLVLNMLLLLGVVIVPFPTALVAEYIRSNDALIAVQIYSGLFVLIAVVFNIIWWYVSHNNRLLDKNFDRNWAASITQQYRFGPVLYIVTFVLAFVSVGASLAMSLGLAIYFALPISAQSRDE